jgi:hypothetical protein
MPCALVKRTKTGEQQQDAHERDQAADPDAQRRMPSQYPQTEQQDGEGEEKRRDQYRKLPRPGFREWMNSMISPTSG